MGERNRTPSVVAAWGESLRSKKGPKHFPLSYPYTSVCRIVNPTKNGEKVTKVGWPVLSGIA